MWWRQAPVSYSVPEIRRLIERMVAAQGEHVTVRTGSAGIGKAYRVQRHYIALHGLKAQELAALAEQGIVEEIANDG